MRSFRRIVNTPLARFAPTLVLSALLAACGGGGGGGSATAPVAPTPPPPAPAPVPVPVPGACKVQLVADTTVVTGKTASATALACPGGVMGEVSWTQVSGPVPIYLKASQSPTVAFETLVEGTVRLRADVRLADGTTESLTTDIAVEQRPPGSYVTVRADHSVRPGTDTSVRAWPSLASGESVTSIGWTQVAGPTVQMNTSEPGLLMFEAPAVESDTVLKFRALMTTSSGRQDVDDVIVSVERQVAATDSLFEMPARVHPYRSAARYAPVLRACTYDVGLYYTDSVRNNFCKASTLPLLQEEAGPGAIPTVAQVMGRVLVSHDFLGRNFEQFLLTQDPHGDFRRMLGATTAIVLGSHVRPSFYMSATGAIYLDANNLWIGAEDRDVVTEVPDYRLAFAEELNYSTFGRQVKNNDYARRSYPLEQRGTRYNSDLVNVLGRLLYHELAHAADFFGPNHRTLNPALTIWENVASRIVAGTLASDVLAAQYPLTSNEMFGLGQVLFQGAKATEEQKQYTAADVGRFFGADRANDDYAYSRNGSGASREDLAMLFEEFMMSYRHGVQYDIGFTNLYRDGMRADEVLVAWGQRGRIAEPAIKPRIKLVLQQVAPWIDQAAVDGLPAPIMMVAGRSWDANLALGTGSFTSGSSAMRIVSEAAKAERLREDYKKPRH